jgi:hypothetical protein
MERSEGNMSLKNPVTAPGIDTWTVRLVAHRLNHYVTPDPVHKKYFVRKGQVLSYERVLLNDAVGC